MLHFSRLKMIPGELHMIGENNTLDAIIELGFLFKMKIPERCCTLRAAAISHDQAFLSDFIMFCDAIYHDIP